MGNSKVPDKQLIRRAAGLTIRERRERLGIAQERLGLECGVDRSYLGQIERGERTPTFRTIHRLLPCLKMTFSEFAVEYERTLKRESRKKGGAQTPPNS